MRPDEAGGSAAVPAAIDLAAVRIVESHEPGRIGQELALGSPVVVIGRGEGCDIPLADPQVSRLHARLEAAGGGHDLVDAGSSNGTWIGPRRVERERLAPGTRFRIGATVFEYAERPSAAAATAGRTQRLDVRALAQLLREVPRLEEVGEPVEASAGRPILLDDPASAWWVETGRVEVFTVALEGGRPVGTRTHFLTAEPGQLLMGMDLAAYDQGSGFVAAGKAGTRLRRIRLARLRELAADEALAERIATLLDGWVGALCRGLTRDIAPLPVVDEFLTAGTPLALEAGQRASSRAGVVWIATEPGRLLFAGLAEVGGGSEPLLLPLGPPAWIELAMPEGTATLEARSAHAAIADPALWRGLAAFHACLCEAEFINKRLAAVDEYNRLQSKARLSEGAREAAYEEIGSVLREPEGRSAGFQEVLDPEPVFRACQLVAGAAGIAATRPLATRQELSFEERVAEIAAASRFRTRVVALRGDWWRRDFGPVLGQVEATKAPVALLPTGPDGYERVDPATGERAPVAEALAGELAVFAWTFYRPFADGPVGVRNLIRFGARGLRTDLGMLIGMGLGLGLLGTLTPYFTGRVFDTAIPQAERGTLGQFATALLVAALATGAFKITQSMALLRVQGRMDYGIQAALWDRLLNLPSTFFKRFSAGDLADRAGGINAIRGLVAGAGVGGILGSLSGLFYLGLMLAYDASLTLLGVALTLFFVAATTGASYVQLRQQRRQMELRGRISGLVLQLISGVAKLRVSGAENHAFRVWAGEFAEQRRIGFRLGRIQAIVATFSSAYPVISSMAIFWLLASLREAAAAEGEAPGMTTGDFIAFSSAFTLFLTAVQALGDSSVSLLKVVPIYERLRPILTTAPEIDGSKSHPGPLKGELEASHISFRYGEDSPWILRDLSIKIRPGEFVAFVGASGCGKSTLMRLLLGFETPEKGAIYYDGQDLTTLDLRLLRQQLGVVLQDSKVLPADIFRNITGTSSLTLQDAWEAAEAAGLAADIQQMPMGMHTYVSEGGGGFSGGQKQRLLIARALVRKPRIVFLDEATSALDNRTQSLVTESMNRLQATRIVIAHRLSTIVQADRICYLEGGAILEEGSFDELMRRDGRFAELARRQLA